MSNVVVKQIKTLFLLEERDEKDLVENYIHRAKQKAIYALSCSKNKYFTNEINPYNSVMYCVFLYWLSKVAYKEGRRDLADKIYYLNKMFNSVDLYYAIDLPNAWLCEHPLGSVMGRAKYGENFFFYQGCTVGGNWNKFGELKYPVIGNNVMMYSNSKILGNSHIGDNCTIAANCYVINQDIPDNSIVFGQSPNLIIKEKKDL